MVPLHHSPPPPSEVSAQGCKSASPADGSGEISARTGSGQQSQSAAPGSPPATLRSRAPIAQPGPKGSLGSLKQPPTENKALLPPTARGASHGSQPAASTARPSYGAPGRGRARTIVSRLSGGCPESRSGADTGELRRAAAVSGRAEGGAARPPPARINPPCAALLCPTASCRSCAEKGRVLIVTIWANVTTGTRRAPEYVATDGLLHTVLVFPQLLTHGLLLTERPRSRALPTSSEGLDQFKQYLAPSSSCRSALTEEQQ